MKALYNFQTVKKNPDTGAAVHQGVTGVMGQDTKDKKAIQDALDRLIASDPSIRVISVHEGGQVDIDLPE